MNLKFIKLEGLGNDFVMVDCADAMHSDGVGSRARYLCDRRRGIGADGVICVLPPLGGNANFRMRIFNADGGEAEMCGNGLRCLGEYLRLTGRFLKEFTVETLAGLKEVEYLREENGEGYYKVNMGRPIFAPDDIPVVAANINDDDFIMREVSVLDRVYKVTAVSMGNPHAVVYVGKLEDSDVLTYGPAIQHHSYFPKSVNVEFVRLISDDEIQMRVYERGCGETHACGTGACAAVVSGVVNDLHGSDVTVHLTGGDLRIFWDGDGSHPVYMSGAARAVFNGDIIL